MGKRAQVPPSSRHSTARVSPSRALGSRPDSRKSSPALTWAGVSGQACIGRCGRRPRRRSVAHCRMGRRSLRRSGRRRRADRRQRSATQARAGEQDRGRDADEDADAGADDGEDDGQLLEGADALGVAELRRRQRGQEAVTALDRADDVADRAPLIHRLVGQSEVEGRGDALGQFDGRDRVDAQVLQRSGVAHGVGRSVCDLAEEFGELGADLLGRGHREILSGRH